MNVTHVARMFKYPRSTVKTIVHTFLQTNRIAKLSKGGSQNLQLEEEHTHWLTDPGRVRWHSVR